MSEPFWTLSAVKFSGFNHISGFTLSSSKKKGGTLNLRFEDDVTKAMCFADRSAAESVMAAMRIIMRSPLKEYDVKEHAG